MSEFLRRPAGFPVLAALAYVLLSSVYFLYWPHAEYFLDDWILLPHLEAAAEGGVSGAAGLALRAAQNRIYDVFRMQWVSILWGALVTWAGGYSARFNFAAVLLLHAANAWLLSQALWRLGVERRFAFLAGTLLLLGPTTHFVLFTYLTNPFFVFSTFWVLLLLWLGSSPKGAPLPLLAICTVAGLFSGEQTFLLLCLVLPLAARCFRRDRPAPGRPMVVVWGAIALALAVYLAVVNQRTVGQEGVDRRYEWTWHVFQNNVSMLFDQLGRLIGVTEDAFFRLIPNPVDLALAAGAAVLVAAVVICGRDKESHVSSLGLAAFGLTGALLGYAPTLWITGGFPFRYDYVPAAFLAVTAVAALRVLARAPRGLAACAGALAAFCTVNAASEIRQAWIPQSQNLRALRAALQRLGGAAPGDILILSGTAYEIGTAQHFAMHSSATARPFAQRTTGVTPLEVGLDLLDDHRSLVLFQRDYQRPLGTAELGRTHILVCPHARNCSSRDWVAREVGPGQFRLFALKGAPPFFGADEVTYTRDQLAFAEERIYFVKHRH